MNAVIPQPVERITCTFCVGTGRDDHGACPLCDGEKMIQPFTMRKPCRFCLEENEPVETTDGAMRSRNGQDVVRCRRCARQCYNAPRSETGKPQRTIKSRPGLKFGQRERILERDGARCWLCGRDPIQHGVILVIAHAVSVKEGREQGATDEELFNDANLFAACEECNAEMGSRSLEPRLLYRVLLARIRRGK
jgi:5-methylcytosine-specific restriction endonuclease McrA